MRVAAGIAAATGAPVLVSSSGSSGAVMAASIDLAPLREAWETVVGQRLPVRRGLHPLVPAGRDPGVLVERAEPHADDPRTARCAGIQGAAARCAERLRQALARQF